MRAKWLWGIWLMGAVAGCGQGNLVFNVDVLSFLSGAETTNYDLPGGVGPVDSTASRFFALPGGFGKSTINNVSITAAATIYNATGSGDVIFDVFFAKTQAGLFTGTPYVTASSGPVSGVDTVPLLPPTTVSPGDTVFRADSLWVGVRARITTNPPLTPHMTGQLRLTELNVRIVLNDKIF
jgi:hypothetical protein